MAIGHGGHWRCQTERVASNKKNGYIRSQDESVMVRIRHRRPYGCPAPGPSYALRTGIVGLGLPPDRLRSLGPRHLGFDRSYCALALGSAHSVGPRHLANDRSYCAFPWVALNFWLSNWSPLNISPSRQNCGLRFFKCFSPLSSPRVAQKASGFRSLKTLANAKAKH